jgi:hypothetical protein
MADIEITQAEADSLIAMEKRFVDHNDWTFPADGERIGLPLAIPRQTGKFHVGCDARADKTHQGDIPESGSAGDYP